MTTYDYLYKCADSAPEGYAVDIQTGTCKEPEGCWQADVADYDCVGYETVGWTCVGVKCAAMVEDVWATSKDVAKCSAFSSPGYIVDESTGTCVAP